MQSHLRSCESFVFLPNDVDEIVVDASLCKILMKIREMPYRTVSDENESKGKSGVIRPSIQSKVKSS